MPQRSSGNSIRNPHGNDDKVEERDGRRRPCFSLSQLSSADDEDEDEDENEDEDEEEERNGDGDGDDRNPDVEREKHVAPRAHALSASPEIEAGIGAELRNNEWHETLRPAGKIDLSNCSTSNRQLVPLFAEKLDDGKFGEFSARFLVGPPAGSGNVADIESVKSATSEYLRRCFGAIVPPAELSLAGGYEAALDMCAYVLFSPGEVILCPSPFSTRLLQSFEERCQVELRPVPFKDLHNARLDVAAFQTAYNRALSKNKPVRGVFVQSVCRTTGVHFNRQDMAAVSRWALQNDLWLIVDEPPSNTTPTLFSAGEVLPAEIDAAMRRRCVRVWTPDEFLQDLGLPGLQFAVIHSAAPAVRKAFRRLAAVQPCAPLVQAYALRILEHYDQLEHMLSEERKRLADDREFFFSRLDKIGIPYVRSTSGYYVFVDLRACIREDGSLRDERRLWRALWQAGVYVSPGSLMGTAQAGWFQLSVAVHRPALIEGLKRLEKVVRLRQRRLALGRRFGEDILEVSELEANITSASNLSPFEALFIEIERPISSPAKLGLTVPEITISQAEENNDEGAELVENEEEDLLTSEEGPEYESYELENWSKLADQPIESLTANPLNSQGVSYVESTMSAITTVSQSSESQTSHKLCALLTRVPEIDELVGAGDEGHLLYDDEMIDLTLYGYQLCQNAKTKCSEDINQFDNRVQESGSKDQYYSKVDLKESSQPTTSKTNEDDNRLATEQFVITSVERSQHTVRNAANMIDNDKYKPESVTKDTASDSCIVENVSPESSTGEYNKSELDCASEKHLTGMPDQGDDLLRVVFRPFDTARHGRDLAELESGDKDDIRNEILRRVFAIFPSPERWDELEDPFGELLDSGVYSQSACEELSLENYDRLTRLQRRLLLASRIRWADAQATARRRQLEHGASRMDAISEATSDAGESSVGSFNWSQGSNATICENEAEEHSSVVKESFPKADNDILPRSSEDVSTKTTFDSDLRNFGNSQKSDPSNRKILDNRIPDSKDQLDHSDSLYTSQSNFSEPVLMICPKTKPPRDFSSNPDLTSATENDVIDMLMPEGGTNHVEIEKKPKQGDLFDELDTDCQSQVQRSNQFESNQSAAGHSSLHDFDFIKTLVEGDDGDVLSQVFHPFDTAGRLQKDSETDGIKRASSIKANENEDITQPLNYSTNDLPDENPNAIIECEDSRNSISDREIKAIQNAKIRHSSLKKSDNRNILLSRYDVYEGKTLPSFDNSDYDYFEKLVRQSEEETQRHRKESQRLKMLESETMKFENSINQVSKVPAVDSIETRELVQNLTNLNDYHNERISTDYDNSKQKSEKIGEFETADAPYRIFLQSRENEIDESDIAADRFGDYYLGDRPLGTSTLKRETGYGNGNGNRSRNDKQTDLSQEYHNTFDDDDYDRRLDNDDLTHQYYGSHVEDDSFDDLTLLLRTGASSRTSPKSALDDSGVFVDHQRGSLSIEFPLLVPVVESVKPSEPRAETKKRSLDFVRRLFLDEDDDDSKTNEPNCRPNRSGSRLIHEIYGASAVVHGSNATVNKSARIVKKSDKKSAPEFSLITDRPILPPSFQDDTVDITEYYYGNHNSTNTQSTRNKRKGVVLEWQPLVDVEENEANTVAAGEKRYSSDEEKALSKSVQKSKSIEDENTVAVEKAKQVKKITEPEVTTVQQSCDSETFAAPTASDMTPVKDAATMSSFEILQFYNTSVKIRAEPTNVITSKLENLVLTSGDHNFQLSEYDSTLTHQRFEGELSTVEVSRELSRGLHFDADEKSETDAKENVDLRFTAARRQTARQHVLPLRATENVTLTVRTVVRLADDDNAAGGDYDMKQRDSSISDGENRWYSKIGIPLVIQKIDEKNYSNDEPQYSCIIPLKSESKILQNDATKFTVNGANRENFIDSRIVAAKRFNTVAEAKRHQIYRRWVMTRAGRTTSSESANRPDSLVVLKHTNIAEIDCRAGNESALAYSMDLIDDLKLCESPNHSGSILDNQNAPRKSSGLYKCSEDDDKALQNKENLIQDEGYLKNDPKSSHDDENIYTSSVSSQDPRYRAAEFFGEVRLHGDRIFGDSIEAGQSCQEIDHGIGYVIKRVGSSATDELGYHSDVDIDRISYCRNDYGAEIRSQSDSNTKRRSQSDYGVDTINECQDVKETVTSRRQRDFGAQTSRSGADALCCRLRVHKTRRKKSSHPNTDSQTKPGLHEHRFFVCRNPRHAAPRDHCDHRRLYIVRPISTTTGDSIILIPYQTQNS